jgi:hypothetical protein
MLTEDNKGRTEKHRECCRVMTYQFAQKDEYVGRAGEKGKEFFVILDGQVRVLVPNEEIPYMPMEDEHTWFYFQQVG